MLFLGQALCRAPTGGNAFRAAAMLPAITGNIGKPGTGLCFLNGKGTTRGLDMGYVGRADLRAEAGFGSQVRAADIPHVQSARGTLAVQEAKAGPGFADIAGNGG